MVLATFSLASYIGEVASSYLNIKCLRPGRKFTSYYLKHLCFVLLPSGLFNKYASKAQNRSLINNNVIENFHLL